MFILTIFVSYMICQYCTIELIEKSFRMPESYSDFMAGYYQTQANWLNFWLTLLACLTAIVGIGLPFVLGQSYREKLKEMECEFDKRIKDIDNYKKLSAENLNTLKSDVREIKRQAEQSKQSVSKILAKELEVFKERMQASILQVKKDAVEAELENLSDIVVRNKNLGRDEDVFNTYSVIIKIGENAVKTFKDCDKFYIFLIENYLEDAYYSRGLIFMYQRKEYRNAISDFIESQNLIKKRNKNPDKTVTKCLLKCRIKLGEYDEAQRLMEEIDVLYPKDIEDWCIKLRKVDSAEAKKLLEIIENKLVQL